MVHPITEYDYLTTYMFIENQIGKTDRNKKYLNLHTFFENGDTIQFFSLWLLLFTMHSLKSLGWKKKVKSNSNRFLVEFGIKK